MPSNFSKPQVLCVVGARPNFTKIAPIMRAFGAAGVEVGASLLHTGQHYDQDMKASFFEQLGIPEPDVDLGVGSGSHAVQTAEIMQRFEPVLDEKKPAAVLVVGDVNSTIACSLVAVKKNVPVIHVEAGLRSGDRSMPEEINRILTDQLSGLLFTTERSARENLLREGISEEKIEFVGNVMIDSLRFNLDRATPSQKTLGQHGIVLNDNQSAGYGVVTLHRPSNVDEPEVLDRLLQTLLEISKETPLIFPMHPRTRDRVDKCGWSERLSSSAIHPIGPQGYLEMLGLMRDASLVLTDSGGLQEETTALGVPCITLRENTERPITVDQGTNTIVGTDPEKIMAVYREVAKDGGKAGRLPELWDGRSAERIVQAITRWILSRPPV